MLADAAHRGKSTALFSQGLGPLESPELLALLRRTCIAGTRAALRESLYGPDLMHRAQARPGQCTVTGDDAVEMSWQRRAAAPGYALGFSLRKVAYSEVEQTHLAQTAQALKALIKTLGTKVVPLPISFNDHERDDEIIAQVLGIPPPAHPMDDPETLISATSECRVLLTGTYHAAVFALAQGIPCVCFYVSNYYRLKMVGLARQFPGGCEVVDLKSPGAIEQLVKNTLRFWESTGPQLRASLLKSAEAQVQTGQGFYAEVMSKILGRTKQPA
jgi:colanic acid/amylovoran biosynthesis protein